MLFCFDLDGTLTNHAPVLGPVMNALQADGHTVHILSGHKGETVTKDVMDRKTSLLHSLGLGDSYSKLVVFADPKNKVAKDKAAYMARTHAVALIDNNKHNVKHAAKIGALGLHVGKKHHES